MKTWNVYFTERHKGRMVTKFVGEIEAAEKSFSEPTKRFPRKLG